MAEITKQSAAHIEESARMMLMAQISAAHPSTEFTPKEIDSMVKKAFDIAKAFHAHADKAAK